MDPAKPTTSKKHAEITKVFQEKLKRKEKLILLLKELLRVRDENFKSKYQQHLAPALLSWQENFDVLKKELLVSAASTQSIVQAKEEYRQAQEKVDESLKAKDAVIAHLEFQTKQLNCALNDFKAKEKLWNERQKQEKKSGISFTINGRRKKLKDSGLDDLPPTPESSISAGSRSNLGSESPFEGNLTPPASASSSSNPTLPWLESLGNQKTCSAEDSDSDDSCLQAVGIDGLSPKHSPEALPEKIRSRSPSISSFDDDDAGQSPFNPADDSQPSPKNKLREGENEQSMMITDNLAAPSAPVVTSGYSIFDCDGLDNINHDPALVPLTEDPTSLSTVITDSSQQPSSLAEKMGGHSPVKAEGQSIESSILPPNFQDPSISTFPSSTDHIDLDTNTPVVADPAVTESSGKKDISGLPSDLDVSQDKLHPVSIPSPCVYQSDTEEELDYIYDPNVPAEEDCHSVSSPSVDSRLAEDVPGVDDCTNQMQQENLERFEAVSAEEIPPTLRSTTLEHPAADVTVPCDIDASTERKETEEQVVTSFGAKNNEPAAMLLEDAEMLSTQSSQEQITLPESPRSPTAKTTTKRRDRFRKRKISECSNISEKLNLSTEPLDKITASDEVVNASAPPLNGLDRVVTQISDNSSFKTPSSPARVLRRSPRHCHSPASTPKEEPSPRRSPRKRVGRKKSTVQTEESEQITAIPATESSQQCTDSSPGPPVQSLNDDTTNLGQGLRISPHAQLPEIVPESNNISASESLPLEKVDYSSVDTLVSVGSPSKSSNMASGCLPAISYSPPSKGQGNTFQGQIDLGVGNTKPASESSGRQSYETTWSTSLNSRPILSKPENTPKCFGAILSSHHRSPHLSRDSAPFKAQPFESFADLAHWQNQPKASSNHFEAGINRSSPSFKNPLYIDTHDPRIGGSGDSLISNLMFGQLCWSFQLLSIEKSDNVCLLKQSSKPEQSPLSESIHVSGCLSNGNQHSFGKPGFGDMRLMSNFNTYRDTSLPAGIKEEHEADNAVAPSMYSGNCMGDHHRSLASSGKFIQDMKEYRGMSPCRNRNTFMSHPGFSQSSANGGLEHNFFSFQKNNFKGDDRSNGCHTCGSCEPKSFLSNGLLATSNRMFHHQTGRYMSPETESSTQCWSSNRNAHFSTSVTGKDHEISCEERNFENPYRSSNVFQNAAKLPTIDLTVQKSKCQAAPLISSPSPFSSRTSTQFSNLLQFRIPEDPCFKKSSLQMKKASVIAPSRLSGTSGVPLAVPESKPDHPGGAQSIPTSLKSLHLGLLQKVPSHLQAGLPSNKSVSDSWRLDHSVDMSPGSSKHVPPSIPLDSSTRPKSSQIPVDSVDKGPASSSHITPSLSLDSSACPIIPPIQMPENSVEQNPADFRHIKPTIPLDPSTSPITPPKQTPSNSVVRSPASSRHVTPLDSSSNPATPPKQRPVFRPQPEKLKKTKVKGSPRSKSPLKCAKGPKDPKVSSAPRRSTPIKTRRQSTESSLGSMDICDSTVDSEPRSPHLLTPSPSKSKTRVSKSSSRGSLSKGSDVSINSECDLLPNADPVLDVTPGNVLVSPRTSKLAVNRDEATSDSPKKGIPCALPTQPALANQVSCSKPLADASDRSDCNQDSSNSMCQIGLAKQPNPLEPAGPQKKPRISKSTTKNPAQLKSAKKSQNTVTPGNIETADTKMPQAVAGTSKISELRSMAKMADHLNKTPTKDAGCGCHLPSDTCICQVERIMLEVTNVQLLLPFPPSPVPSKKKKSTPNGKSKLSGVAEIQRSHTKLTSPDKLSNSQPTQSKKRKLGVPKSVPSKKKPKSAEFVEESTSSDSDCNTETPEPSKRCLAKNDKKCEASASNAITACARTEEHPREPQHSSGTVEDNDPSSDGSMLAANKSDSSPEKSQLEIHVEKGSAIAFDDDNLNVPAPVDGSVSGSKNSPEVNIPTADSASIKAEHNYYLTQSAVDTVARTPKIDPFSSRRNELNHLASFFQKSASSEMSLRLAESEDSKSSEARKNSDSDSDSQMCIDEQTSRCPETVEPRDSLPDSVINSDSQTRPLSYWTETTDVSPDVAPDASNPTTVLNFYRANDNPQAEDAQKNLAPQGPDVDDENSKSSDDLGVPNFYTAATDAVTESVSQEANPNVAADVRQFLTMCSTAESVQQAPDEVIPCSLNIMAFASHYKLPKEQKSKVPHGINKSTESKILNCLGEYLKGDFTAAKWEKAGATIKNANPHHVAMVLCRMIGNIAHEVPSDKDSPKPLHVLSPKAKRLLLLVIKLANGRLEYFDAILSKLEFSMLPVSKDYNGLIHVPTAVWYVNLSSFYAALCHSQGFGLRCQGFIYDCLYGRHISSFLIIYVMLGVFPWALPKARTDPLGPLCFTIAYLIMKQGIFGSCHPNLISSYKVTALRKKLTVHYGYKFSPDVTRDHVIVELVSKIKNKGADMAIVLLCKSQGFKWTQTVANKFFFPILNNWISDQEKDEALVVLITQILGKISRGFAGSVGTSFVSTSLKYMDLLLRIKSSLAIADAVMESLVHFSRLDIDGVAKIISTWSPNDYKVTPSAVKSVQKILKVRIGSFWDTWTPKKR